MDTLPPGVFETHVAPFIQILDLIQLWRTSHAIGNIVTPGMIFAQTKQRAIARCFEIYPVHILQEAAQYEWALSGSLLLSVILNTKWQDQDIDLFVCGVPPFRPTLLPGYKSHSRTYRVDERRSTCERMVIYEDNESLSNVVDIISVSEWKLDIPPDDCTGLIVQCILEFDIEACRCYIDSRGVLYIPNVDDLLQNKTSVKSGFVDRARVKKYENRGFTCYVEQPCVRTL
jgi:hypothetical protein